MTKAERELCIKTKRKKCPRCKIEKPFKEFYKNPAKLLGINSECKVCHAKNDFIYRLNNPEKLRNRNKKWRENNPEKFKKVCKKWREENYEKVIKSKRKSFKRNRDNLTDVYVANLIKKTSKIKIGSSPIPQKLIKPRRQSIKLYRLLFPNTDNHETSNRNNSITC